MIAVFSRTGSVFYSASVEVKFTPLVLSMQRLLDVIVSNRVKVRIGLVWCTGDTIVITDIVCIVHCLIEIVVLKERQTWNTKIGVIIVAVIA